MVINLSSLPQDIIDEYGLLELSHDGCVYIDIQKYHTSIRHPRERIVTKKIIFGRVSPHQIHPWLMETETRPVWFSLVVDDFGIKYIGRVNAKHLMTSIKKNYAISRDWTGSAYCGLKLD
jgi:hypothetical protein